MLKQDHSSAKESVKSNKHSKKEKGDVSKTRRKICFARARLKRPGGAKEEGVRAKFVNSYEAS